MQARSGVFVLLAALFVGCGQDEIGFCEIETNGVTVCVVMSRSRCLDVFDGASSASADGLENPDCVRHYDAYEVSCEGSEITDSEGTSYEFAAETDEDCAVAAGG